MINIGTSGYSFQDWKGSFYPKDIQNNDMLDFYVKHFKTVEINYTYYRIPTYKSLDGMCRKTPKDFKFIIKAFKGMTHERDKDLSVFNDFKEAIKPLENAGKFSGLLAQFPWSYKNNKENREYLSWFKEQSGDELPLIVEFRNDSWIIEPIFDFLRTLNISYCCVDEPQLKGLVPPVTEVTGSLGYIRFHGRNAKKWWSGDSSERYDYLYTQQELFEWKPKIEKIEQAVEETFVFFNNCHAGQAASNAQMMLDIFK